MEARKKAAAPLRSETSISLKHFHPNADVRSLTLLFLAWKCLLLAVACISPGDGYDTSTRILFDQYSFTQSDAWVSRAVEHVSLKLTRWDGIYFATLTERGHLHEQEWAFSYLLTRTLDLTVRKVLLWPFALSPIIKSALSGIIISHLSHLLAVIALYHLTIELISAKRQFTKRQIAFIASCLHIISPAGLFLSAPYGESIFALLNFAGTLAYIKAVRIRFQHPDRFTKAECLWIIHAGTRFAFAAMVRSNGLLSGLIFAWDAIEAISQPQRLPRDSQAGLRFAATIFAGALVGLGFVAPQSFAWAEYCMYAKTRPWCSRFPPSIYSWVQDHYWGVGFMKYWTWNNLPLFLLAAPMLLVLLSTGYAAMRWPVQIMAACDTAGGAQRRQQDTAESMDTEQKVFKYVLPRLALPQLVLTVMAASSFHVQIINRISSGYPIWYVLLAVTISSSSPTSSASEPQTTTSTIDPSGPHDAKAKGQTDATMTNVFGLSKSRAQWLVRGMVLYAIIQGGLFASFLPPA